MLRSLFSRAAVVFLAGVMMMQLAVAQEFKEGQHYEVLTTPVLTRDKSKIEVVELFWYGCIHCFNFEASVQQWKKGLPADVDFHQMPAMWGGSMDIHAAAFYTAKAMGILDDMHPKIFAAMNVEKKRFKSVDSIVSFFSANGADAKKTEKTMKSFGVQSQVNLAKSRARSYRMQGTPELVINGKYRISSSKLPNGQADLLKVADFLIAKERAAIAGKAAKTDA